MSSFSGSQGRGARRALRKTKRAEAEAREADTTRIMHEQNVSRHEAQRVGKASRKVAAMVTAARVAKEA